MMDVFMQLSSIIIFFMVMITGTLVLMAGLLLICVDTCRFCWKRIFRKGKVYRA